MKSNSEDTLLLDALTVCNALVVWGQELLYLGVFEFFPNCDNDSFRKWVPRGIRAVSKGADRELLRGSK